MGTYLNDNGTLKRIAGGTLYADAPVGTIQAYGGAIDSTHQAPSGWLLCDGSEKDIADFADLYAVIGDAFGTPSVNTKFVLPDLIGKFAEGTPSGGTLGESKSAGLPNITGHFNADYLHHGGGVWNGAFDKFVQASGTQLMGSGVSQTTNSAVHFDASKSNAIYGASDTVQPPAVCVNYIIKAKQTALPVDLASEVAKLNSPDWSNAVELDYATYGSQFLAGTYEVPDDGWLVGYWLGNASADTLTINDVVVGASSYANSNWCGYGHVNMKVNKGDKVKISSVFSSAFFVFSFVPHK